MLPNTEPVAVAMVVILSVIVAWDAWWLTRQHLDIPQFGPLANNGFAWKSERSHEVFRQWANLGSMAAMMALPWGFASFSDTPIIYVIVWDILNTSLRRWPTVRMEPTCSRQAATEIQNHASSQRLGAFWATPSWR